MSKVGRKRGKKRPQKPDRSLPEVSMKIKVWLGYIALLMKVDKVVRQHKFFLGSEKSNEVYLKSKCLEPATVISTRHSNI